MNLYLDLKKAVGQVPSTATDTVSEREDSRRYKESFSRRSSGVLGGDASPDDPQVGGKWSHDEALDDELENDRKTDTQIAQERGIVGKPEQSKAQEAADMLKSFTFDLQQQVSQIMPNECELEYLTDVCGYTREDVIKGLAKIEGFERAKFNAWLNARFQQSVSRLKK